MTMPRTVIDPSVVRYRSPMFRFVPTMSLANGSTAHDASIGQNTSAGAATKNQPSVAAARTAGRFRSSRPGAGAHGREATRSPLTFLSTARVATRREKRLSKGMPGEALLEEDAAEVGMTVELDAEHVVCLALAPIRAFPYGCERRNVRVELRARGAQHDRDLRARTANERHRAELRSRVDAGVDGVEVATCARVVANERRDLDQSFAIDVENEHVVQRRHASLLAEARGDVRPKVREVDRGARRAQYQFRASFFHA